MNNKSKISKVFKALWFILENIDEVFEIKKALDKTKKFDEITQYQISDEFINGMDEYLEKCILKVMEKKWVE